MNWYIVDKKYINYLTQFDSHVGYVEYGERLKTSCRNSSYNWKFSLLCPYLFRQTQTSENVKQSGFPQTSG